MARGAWQATVHEVSRVRHYLATKPPLPLIVCTCQPQSPSWPHTLFPPWGPYIYSLPLCLYFCFANRFICTSFYPNLSLSGHPRESSLCHYLVKLSWGVGSYMFFGALLPAPHSTPLPQLFTRRALHTTGSSLLRECLGVWGLSCG